MDLARIPAGPAPPHDLNVVVEIALGGQPVKYEIDKVSGGLFVDRFLHTAMFYPGNYGFVPHTLARDGDPIDVLIVGPGPVVPGAVVRCRPIGALLMEEEHGPDEKIIAVPVDRLHPFYSGVRSYQDLPPILCRQIAHFFRHYKDLEPGKWVAVEGWAGPDEAAEMIAAAIARAAGGPPAAAPEAKEERMAKGVLIAAMDFSAVAADEFNDWYDHEHIPERRRVPGFLSLERWLGAADERQSVATYDLETPGVLDSPAYRAIGGENLSPWSKRVTVKCRRMLRFEGEQILPGGAGAPEGAGGLLLVAMTPSPEVETAFNAWYDTEHVPALARVPGVLSARRFRAGGGNPRYVALYHLAEPGVQESREWQAAVAATPMPDAVRPQISDRLRLVCRRYARAA